MSHPPFLDDSITLLRQMIAVPSLSCDEAAVSTLVASHLDALSLPFFRLHNNIIAWGKDYSPAKPTLLLCAHLDTVAPSSDYSFDPYSPAPAAVKEAVGAAAQCPAEEIIAGVGANDDGASVVALVATFRHYSSCSLPVNLLLVLTAEEERAGEKGMTAVWHALSEGAIPALGGCVPTYAILGEPTALRVATAERGLLVLDGAARGTSGHAARGDGDNAIYIALHDIATLLRYPFPRVSQQLGAVRVAVTQINAGTAHNVIPSRCSFVVDIRPTEQYTPSEILTMLQKVCRSTLTPRCLTHHASSTAAGSPFLAAADSRGLATYASETCSDWLHVPCDAIKMGPGVPTRSHHKDEFVTVPEVAAGITCYLSFLDTFFKQSL